MSALDSPLVVGAVTAVLGIFGGGTLVSLLKLPGDKERVVIEAAQGAVVLQTGVLESLHAEIARLNLRVEAAEHRISLLTQENAQLRRSTGTRLNNLEQNG